LFGTVRYRNRKDDTDADGSWIEISRLGESPAPATPATQAAGEKAASIKGKLGRLLQAFNRRSVKSKRTISTLEEFVAENTHTILRRSIPDKVDSEIPEVKSRVQSSTSGFITAVLLSDPRRGPKGVPLSVLMQAATGTSGGRSNIVAPAPWNSSHFALVDSEMGLAQVWKLDGLMNLPREGPRGKFQQLSSKGAPSYIDPGYASIRTSIVAEWRAPPEAVGNPLTKSGSGRDNNEIRMVNSQPTVDEHQRYRTLNEQASQYNVPYDTNSGSAFHDYTPGTQEAAQEGEEIIQKRQFWGIGSRPQTSQNPQTPTDDLLNPIPSGRGCCANAIWLT
jgi:hypothetical protein